MFYFTSFTYFASTSQYKGALRSDVVLLLFLFGWSPFLFLSHSSNENHKKTGHTCDL